MVMMMCVPTLLLATNLFRIPVVSWHDNAWKPALPPSGTNNNTLTTNSTNRTLPLLNYSCGCWDAVAESRWVQLSLRAPTAVFGVEATLGHHFRVNVSSDGVNWSLYAGCASSPCVFASGPVLAQHVRIVVTWFDAQQDTPRFQGSVLGCRFHVRQGIGSSVRAASAAASVGLTSSLFLIGRDPLDPTARPGPPTVVSTYDNSSSTPARLVPFNCTDNNTSSNNASLVWLQSALGLPPWMPPPLLRTRILGACATFPPSTPRLIWLARVDLPASPAATTTCQPFLAAPPRISFQLTVTGP